jgi:SAM-dependent methyltransferase
MAMNIDWLLKLDYEEIEDALEDIAASEHYWSNQDVQGFTYENYSLFYITFLARLISYFGCRDIVELGCGSGRNIKTITQMTDVEFRTIKGFDFNEKYIAFGREKFGLDVSNENILDMDFDHDDGCDSACFSVSVLDHIVNIEALVAGLTKKFGFVALIEPAQNYEPVKKTVKLKSVNLNGITTFSQPFTYLHNYKTIFSQYGFYEILNIPLWTSAWGSGPAYRLMIFSKNKPDDKGDLMDVVLNLINKSVSDERAEWRRILNISKRKHRGSLDEVEKLQELQASKQTQIEKIKTDFLEKQLESDVLYGLVKRLNKR